MNQPTFVDLRYFEALEEAEPELPPAIRRKRDFYGRIAEVATAWPLPGQPHPTTIRCRRRPQRRPCPGRLVVLRTDVPSQIEWACPQCDDGGLVKGWRNTGWDLSLANADDLDEEPCRIDLDFELYDGIAEILSFDGEAMRVVRAAIGSDGRAILLMPRELLDDLVGPIRFEARRHGDHRRRLLEQALDRIIAQAG